jgi:hypothetical protein
MRASIVLVVLVVGAFWWGGHIVYVGLRNGTQVELTCAEYERARPDAEWLRLTRCAADVDHIAIVTSSKSGRITKVYIPLRPEGASAAGAPHLVVERDDDAFIELVARAEHGAAETTSDQIVHMLDEPVDGLVQIGLSLSDKRQQELRGLRLGLDHDFAIIERGAKPTSPWLGIGVIALAAGVCAWVIVGFVRRRRRDRAAIG